MTICILGRWLYQSIVQGCGIGPQLYIILKSGVKPLSADYIIIEYADYNALLLPIACFWIAVIM